MIAERVELATLRSLAPPKEDQVHVWLCRIGDFASHIDALHALLSATERDQAARFASRQARDRFLVGRGVVRSLLGAYLAVPVLEVAIETDRNGKPRVTTTGDDRLLMFNLAHSGDFVLLGFACGSEIGVDLERHRPVTHWQQIAERHYSHCELAALQATSADEQRELFFRIWTRKEAALKWHGTGLQLPLSTVEVPISPRCQAWIELPPEPQRCWVQQLNAPAEYSAALATSGPITRVLQREVVWS